MTLEIYSGPGVETYRSTKFSTTVETIGGVAQTPYTYGVSEVSTLTVTHLWPNGSSPEMSWITYGSNETTIVRVSLIGSTITSATIYPKALDVKYYIESGILIIKIPSHRKIWVEVNGDKAEPLFIFADELKPTIPTGYVTFSPGNTSVAAGAKMYFPPGVHNIGQKFKVNTGSTVYLDGGAWLIGSFDVYDRGDVTITGPGVLSGESIAWADVQALGDWQSQMEYCMIYAGSVGIRSAHVRNNLKRITIVNAPWYNQTYGINYISDVKIIGPWHQNTDGFSPELDASNGNRSTVTDCFSYTGDDNMKAVQSSGNHTITGCFMINSAAGSIRFGYWPWPPNSYATVINNNYIYPLHKYYGSHEGAFEGSEIIACQVDGEAGEETWGRFNVTISNLYVEGTNIQAPLFVIKNRVYQWGTPALAYGQISNWVLSNIYVESVPTVKSQLIGLDSTNTPHDITFSNIVIGTVKLTNSNWATYVTQNEFPYNTSITTTSISGIIHWRTPNGIRREFTSPDKTLSIDVEAECDLNYFGENGVKQVEFYVSENGGAPTTITVSSRSMRIPNYSTTPSLQPGGPSTGPASFWAYGTLLDLETLAPGTITVTAKMISNTGTETALSDTLTIYNDTDGGDRRPSTKEIYYDYDNGSDSNIGTILSPVKTLQKAISLAVNNPSGSTYADRDAGGAKIFALGRTVGAGGEVTSASWHTSGAWALTVEAIGADRTYRRTVVGSNYFTAPHDYTRGAGFTGAQTAHIIFKGFEIIGAGFTVQQSGSTTVIVSDFDCTSHSYYWTGRTAPHVNYAIDGGGMPTNIEGTGKKYSWGHYRYGVSFGFSTYYSLFDFKLSHVLGVMLLSSNGEGVNPVYTCGYCHTGRYNPGEVEGYVQTTISYGTNYTAGASIAVTVPIAGQMRIDAINSNPNDFGTAAAFIAGSTYWGIRVSGFGDARNNGDFAVISAGTNSSGRPYVVLNNPNAVAQTAGPYGSLSTVELSGAKELYITKIHTDILQILGDHTGALFAHISGSNISNFRSWVGAGRTLTRTVFKNITDGGYNQNSFDFASSTLTNCLFLSVTATSNSINFSGTFTGNNFVDCVFGNGNQIPTSNSFIHSCHFINGTTSGTNPTSGTWLKYDPLVSPYSFEPLDANMNTASIKQAHPGVWRWATAISDSRGAYRNVGGLDWTTESTSGSTTPDPLVLTASAPDVIRGRARRYVWPPHVATSSIPTTQKVTRKQIDVLTTQASVPDIRPRSVIRFDVDVTNAVGTVNAVSTTTVVNLNTRTSSQITVNSTPLYAVSVSSYLYDPTIIEVQSSEASVFLGERVTVTITTVPQLTVASSTIEAVFTTHVPTGPTYEPGDPADPANETDPGVIIIVEPGSVIKPYRPDLPNKTNIVAIYNRKEGKLDSKFFTAHLIDYTTKHVLPVLKELNEVKHDPARLSDVSKETWSEVILDNIDNPTSNKEVINILTSNYKDFTNTKNNIAGKIIPDRTPF